MSFEWAGPVATGTVGIAGIAATFFTQREGRTHALELSREARTQDRRQGAYERILLTALKTTEFVEGADLIWERLAMPPDVDSENFDMWVLTDLYTSPEFQGAYRKWIAALDATRKIGDEVSSDERIWDQAGDTPERYQAAANQMRLQYDGLAEVARRELQGR